MATKNQKVVGLPGTPADILQSLIDDGKMRKVAVIVEFEDRIDCFWSSDPMTSDLVFMGQALITMAMDKAKVSNQE